ncbi:MAG TPA: carboxypeptidase-like regulatory domain-containing protein [Vicinamibacterales bacterium]|nr:carboxypeptidase-like regulatory domain-containing protein [Vicinamibacterales bacterium]
MHTRLPFRWLAAVAAMSAFLTVAQAQQGAGAGQGRAGQQGGGAQQGRGGGRGGGQQPARDAQVQQSTGTAMILGQVVTGDAGTPVRRARVNLMGQELRGQKATMTDDEGRFVFTLLPAGRYTVNATKTGYVTIAYGAKAPGRAGTPIQLSDGQKLETKSMSLPKGGVVTGTVLDEHGEPAPGTRVLAMRQVIRTGQKSLESAGNDTTDDRGQYRIYGLLPGQFVVYAQPRNQGVGGLQASIATEIESAVQQMAQMLGGGGRGAGGGQAGRAENLGDRLAQLGGGRGQQALEQLQQQLNPEGQQAVTYAPVFYPGSTSPSNASRVEIVAGQERAGVDFQLQLTQTSQVDGVVLSPDDAQPNGTQITLVPKDSLPGLPGNTQTTRAGQNGQFTFRNVIPGQYSVVARGQVRPPVVAGAETEVAAGGRGGRGGGRGAGGAPPEVLWALADLTVDGRDQTGVSLQLQRGMTISGRIAFDGQGAPPTDLTRARVNLMTVGAQDVDFGGIPPAMVDANGRFTMTGVPPGRYSLRANIGGLGARLGGPAGAQQTGTQPAGATQAGAAVSWQLASSMAGGRDSLDFPLVIGAGTNVTDVVITFADKSTELTGTLQDAAGAATSDYSIIVFPSDQQYWQPQSRRIQSVRPGTDGKFTVRNLPPGAYSVVAVTDVEPGEWYDPEFLSQLAGAAMRVTLGAGEKKTQDIRIAGGL